MGIRFTCPSGHKLNVKSFLAGRKGACPHCGARIEIPRESTRPAGHHRSSSTAQRDDAEDDEPELASIAETIAEPLEPTGDPPAATFATQIPAGPSPAAPHASAAAVALPRIDEAPSATWYYRLPHGEQFGPLTATAMRERLEARQVPAEALIWRDDWRDWQSSTAVFPQLYRPAPAAAPNALGPAAPLDSLVSLGTGAASSRVIARRRRQHNLFILTMVLIAVAMVLVAVFVFVLVRQFRRSDAAAPLMTYTARAAVIEVCNEINRGERS